MHSLPAFIASFRCPHVVAETLRSIRSVCKAFFVRFRTFRRASPNDWRPEGAFSISLSPASGNATGCGAVQPADQHRRIERHAFELPIAGEVRALARACDGERGLDDERIGAKAPLRREAVSMSRSRSGSDQEDGGQRPDRAM